eukprot:TRINITY_DN39284_c0_g1_i1.p2 TRINITY_DN39284_c0_g1~~TRINITY_DN39284_c0_g1_i1.p2  ORF type:complete len:373 (-),score=62.69 TRINITY_DN39284_c0_g1_i1:57-1100(-)
MSAPAPSRVVLRPKPNDLLISPSPQQYRTGIIVLIIAGLIVLMIIFRERLLTFFRIERRTQGGRWVSDRSLGGKMVFVADSPKEEIVVKQEVFDSSLRRLRQKEGGGWVAAISSDDEREMEVPQQKQLPSWWDVPPPKPFVSETTKENYRKQAQMVLKTLEVGKMTRGIDYPPSLVLELYQYCREGDIIVQPRTESGRDSLYRTAVEVAVEEVVYAGSNAQLVRQTAPRFVGGYAECLGISDERAIEICLGVISSRLRSELLGIAAQIRAQSKDVVYGVQAVSQLFDVFPLSRKMAQPAMIGKSLDQKTTVEERRKILTMLIDSNYDHKDVYAEMLGFKPELVFGEE